MVESAADRLSYVQDFGVSAVYDSNTIKVLFNAEFDLDAASTVQTTDFVIEAPTSSLTGVVQGESITVASVAYRINAVMEDGTGWTRLMVEKS